VRRLLGIVGLMALVLVGAPPFAAPPARAVATVRESGYLVMEDGTRLGYTVVRPAEGGPWPTLFEYSGYDPGINPDGPYIRRFVEGIGSDGGYAFIGVNLRGTGCSDGTFDFFQPQEGADGARVIKWITEQPWSNGRVGMIGKSYPGITQLFVAEQQPPGLMAITPGHFFADAYRDVARPGGIMNIGFATLWSFIARPSYEVQDSPGEIAGGDLQCINAATGEIRGLPKNPFVQLLQHQWDDALVQERSPITHLDRIKVPIYTALAWQDEQLASRQSHLLWDLDDLNAQRRARGEPVTPWWAILSNGDHGMYRTPAALDELERFLDRFVKGEANGWEQRPPVEVWWEAGRDHVRAPGWVTSEAVWSEPQREAAGRLQPWPLQLRAGGRLTDEAAAADEPSTSYAYVPVVGSQGLGNPRYSGVSGTPSFYLWKHPPAPGTAAAFTSAPMPTDRMLLGSASLDVWLTSTAPDTDLQVTLSELRPDGKEQYIQKGWLRVSQRATNPARSTALRPWQTHQKADAANLHSGEPVLARVEIFPFGHVVRAGSRLRVWVEGPTALPELWSFVPVLTPAQNRILHDTAHPSKLVLPLVPGGSAGIGEYAECGSVIRQPCRDAASSGEGSETFRRIGSVIGDDDDDSGAPGDGSTTPATGGHHPLVWLGPVLLVLAYGARRRLIVPVRKSPT
jgi:uncharacterized protein